MISCSDSLDDELFMKNVYLKDNGWIEYELDILDNNVAELPILMYVNGTEINKNNIKIWLGIDKDTLAAYNQDKYKNQTELFYDILPTNSYHFDADYYSIQSGSLFSKAIVNIELDKLQNLFQEFVLPIKIDVTEGEPIAESKYSKVLAYISFKNKFSGVYGGSGSLIQEGTDYSTSVQNLTLKGVNRNDCYFYAGNVTKSNNSDYHKYVVVLTMDSDEKLTLSTPNSDLNLESETANISRKYVTHATDNRYYIETTTIELKYKYDDLEESGLRYTYSGSLSKTGNVLKSEYPNVVVED